MSALPSLLRRFVPGMAALALAGCATVGPDYAAPELPAGLSAADETTFEATDELAVTSQPLPTNWWKLYEDARLDALVEEALAANTDLRVAAANLERARAFVREVGAQAGLQTALDGSTNYAKSPTLGAGATQPARTHFAGGIGIS